MILKLPNLLARNIENYLTVGWWTSCSKRNFAFEVWGVMDVTEGGRISMLLMAVVFWSDSRLNVEESEPLMRLGIDELVEFVVIAQFMVDKLADGVTVGGRLPEAPVTELCWKAVLVASVFGIDWNGCATRLMLLISSFPEIFDWTIELEELELDCWKARFRESTWSDLCS